MKFVASAMIAILALGGCRGQVKGTKQTSVTTPTSAPTPVIERAEGSFRPPPAPRLPVKQGPAPLAYIVERGGTIRIADAESGATLAETVAGPRSIVSVDAKAGVRVGRELLVNGPLPTGRSYQIFLDENDVNLFRTEHARPGTK